MDNKSTNKDNTSSTEMAPLSNAGRPCVYVLRCKDGTLYTGWTNDFEKRLQAHNSGKGAKYTRGRGPVEPVYLEYCEDKVAATKREAAIKKLPLKKKQLLISSNKNILSEEKFSLYKTMNFRNTERT